MIYLINNVFYRVCLHIITLIILLLSSLQLYAQLQPVYIHGAVIADSGRPVTNSYIKISNKSSRQISAYFNTGNTNYFSTGIQISKADTFIITASHIGFDPVSVCRYLFPGQSADSITLLLLPLQHTLNDVTVKSQKIWVRGDTTFYNAEAFKEGDEKKLVDLIAKMPGFEVDPSGNLLYKKKQVEKITVDGEELFADKVKLLLNNFPVHVLSTIQAIENQTSDKLLKGLNNDKKVFVNLGLNKAKLKMAFGDGEIGIGTLSRYLFSPVVFSLYGKFKIGYIGNWDAAGSSFKQQDRDPDKYKVYDFIYPMMMSVNNIPMINNFNNTRYINNRLSDNQLQLNLPLSKKIHTSTVLSGLADKQTQFTSLSSSLYNDTIFFKRYETNQYQYKPRYIFIKEKIEWLIDTTSLLTAKFSFYNDKSNALTGFAYQQEEQNDTGISSIKNNFNSYYASLGYTLRKSEKSAVKLFGIITNTNSLQNTVGISSSWKEIFELPDDGYNVAQINGSNRFFTGLIGMELLHKKGGNLISTEIIAQTEKVLANNLMEFNSATKPLPSLPFTELSNKGAYRKSALFATTSAGMRIFKTTFNTEFFYGIGNINLKEKDTLGSSWIPLYGAALSKNIKLAKNIDMNYAASYMQTISKAYQLHRSLFPNSIKTFHQNVDASKPLRVFDATIMLSYLSITNLITGNLMMQYKRDFSSFVQTSSYNRFVQLNTNLLIAKPLNSISFSANYTIPSLSLKAKFWFGGGVNYNENLLIQPASLLHSKNVLQYLFLNIKRNWDKKFFIEAEGNFTRNKTILPQELKGQVEDDVKNLSLLLRQRLFLHKSINIVLLTEYFNNNISSPNNASFIFLDAECNFKIPKSSFFVSVKAANLTNEKFYYMSDNQALSQSFISVPLIKRNIFVSLRYQF